MNIEGISKNAAMHEFDKYRERDLFIHLFHLFIFILCLFIHSLTYLFTHTYVYIYIYISIYTYVHEVYSIYRYGLCV